MGPILRRTLLGELPERRRRIVWGGRAPVRATLYINALVATRRTPVTRGFYLRLVAAGKPKKAASLAHDSELAHGYYSRAVCPEMAGRLEIDANVLG